MSEMASSDPSFWQRLERLRGVFLGRESQKNREGQEAYWQNTDDLRAYDETFARRIAAKWNFALEQLEEGFESEKLTWVDWACGSGVASERLLELFPKAVEAIELCDHSSLALNYSRQKLEKKAEGLGVGVSIVSSMDFAGKGVLLSHVLNELSDADATRIVTALQSAERVIWVESGSRQTSRALSAVRDRLLRSGDFRVQFPCPQLKGCGMLVDGNESHWCHFFAKTPAEWSQSAFWSEFSQKMKIDLRSLPLSGLILRKTGNPTMGSQDARLIGLPRVYKGYQKILTCNEEQGVSEKQLDKRQSKELFKHLAKNIGKDNSLTRIEWKLGPEPSKIVDATLKT